MSRDRWPRRRVRVGPFAFLLRSPLREVIAEVEHLYRDYPDEPAGIVDYTVSIMPPSGLRRWLRPKLVLACDIELLGMAPVPPAHGLLGLEMGMNLQLAAGMNRFLLLHASAVEHDGGAILMMGDSGAGKSTLSAILGYGGWRFLGDEFALVEPADGRLHPFPRPISLKNGAIELFDGIAPAERFGPRFDNTIKGTVRHLLPPVDAIAAMDVPATPRLILMPEFKKGAPSVARRLGQAETFTRLSRASTNYGQLGEAGFTTLARLVETAPAYEISYGSSEAAKAIVDKLWGMHG